MAIRKKEVLGRLTPWQKDDAAELELVIDHQIRKEYTGQGRVIVGRVIVQLPNAPCSTVREEIEARYRLVGWKVEFHVNAHDATRESFVELS